MKYIYMINWILWLYRRIADFTEKAVKPQLSMKGRATPHLNDFSIVNCLLFYV